MKRSSFKNVLKKVTITTFGIMLTSQVVFGANSWTDARTYQLKSDSGYTTATTTGNKLSQEKKTDAPKWKLGVVRNTGGDTFCECW